MGKEELDGSHERVKRESIGQDDVGLGTSNVISRIHKKTSRPALGLIEDERLQKKCKSRLTVQEEPYASGGVVSGKRSLESLYTCGIFAESWPTWAFHIGAGSVNLKWIHLRSPKY